MKEEGCEFQLFKGNEELYHKYKDNLVGGPKIIFHHYHEKNKTKIRRGKVCKKILGYDANSLYLYAIGLDMLCGQHQKIEPYDGILKHEKVKIVSSDKYNKNIRMNGYKSHEDLYEGFEFHFNKMSFKLSLPVQIGFAVYQLAKLQMLEFYYDYYCERSDFQFCLMDAVLPILVFRMNA